MPSVKLYYMITNGGDGSASANFYADEKTCQFACDTEEEAGEAFCETWPQEATFDFDAKGKLLNPDGTKESMETYVAGYRQGYAFRWHANGRMKSVEHFTDGRRDGQAKFWDEAGRIIACFAPEGAGCPRTLEAEAPGVSAPQLALRP